MTRRISHEVAAGVMLQVNLRPLEDYPGASKPWRCLCLVCGNEVSPHYSSVQQGNSKCAWCAGLRVNPEIAEQKMQQAGFKPLIEYPGSRVPWQCECLKCGKVSKPAYTSVLKGTGCRHCAKNAPVDPVKAKRVMEDVDLEPQVAYPGGGNPWLCICKKCRREVRPRYDDIKQGQGGCVYCSGRIVNEENAIFAMEARFLTPLVPYPGAAVPWLCRCTKCEQEVTPTYNGIQQGRGGCRFCAPNAPFSESDALMELRERNLDPLETFPGTQLPWRCKCLICGHEVSPRLNNLMHGQSGCGYCAGNRVDEIEAIKVMQEAGLKVVVPYPGGKAPWSSICLKCERTVSPQYQSILRGGGCRYCATMGFDFESPALVYVLTHPVYLAHKVGIAALSGKRLQQLGRRGWEVFRTVDFSTGDEAYEVEQSVLSWMRDELGLPPYLSANEGDGWTETVSADAVGLERLWAQVELARAESE